MTIETIIAILSAYLIGSISSAILICRLIGLPDPRTQGSGNPGATNVLRVGGKKAAAVTLLGDALKGLIPVLAAKWYGLDDAGLSLVAFAAFIGHLFPIFFYFKGGKGVATLIGCLLAVSWPAGLCWIATWLTMTFIFRYSSLSALTASVLTPFYIWYFTNSTALILGFSLMSLILIYRHRSNITNLMTGKEKKI